MGHFVTGIDIGIDVLECAEAVYVLLEILCEARFTRLIHRFVGVAAARCLNAFAPVEICGCVQSPYIGGTLGAETFETSLGFLEKTALGLYRDVVGTS